MAFGWSWFTDSSFIANYIFAMIIRNKIIKAIKTKSAKQFCKITRVLSDQDKTKLLRILRILDN